MQREVNGMEAEEEEEEEVAGSSWRQPLARAASSAQGVSLTIRESADPKARVTAAVFDNTYKAVLATLTQKKCCISMIDLTSQASSKIETDAAVTCLSWQEDILLARTSNGTALVYRGASPSAFPHPTIYRPPPIPGTSGGRIGAVALSSARETGLFISTHREVFHVWNVERTAEPLLSKRATRLTLSSAAWSSERDIFALGDTDGRIRLLDTRVISSDSDEIAEGRSTAWCSEAADKAAVTCIAWNPFIPTCFAASTDSGSVNIYDVRFGASPLLTVGLHLNGVSAAQFSPHNAELLHAAGADARWSLLSLSTAPHCVVGTSPALQAPVVAVGCPDVQFRFLAACANGSIAALSIQDSLISSIVPSRFPADAVEERAIENCIYRRDFNTALDRVAALSQKYAAEKRLEQALPLLQPLKCDVVVTPLDAALAGGAAAQQGIAATAKLRAFLNDVAALASSLPPTLAPRIDQRRLERAMGVKWAAQLLHSVKQEKLAHVVALLPEVVSRLTADPRSIESGATLELMNFLLAHDYLRAQSLGAQLAALFITKSDAWRGFIPAIHLLLYPTLWDSLPLLDPPPPPPAAFIAHAAANKEAVVQQLSVMHKMTSALWTRADPVPFIPSNAPLLSAASARMALHALLRARHFEDCFALANEQLAASSSLASHSMFVSFLEDYFFPQFSRIVSAVNNPSQCGPLLTSLVYFTSKFPAITAVASLDEQLHKQVRRSAAAARERLKDLSREDRISASAALRADLGSSFDVNKVREPHKRTLQNLMHSLEEFTAGRLPKALRKRSHALEQSLLEASGEVTVSIRKSSSGTVSRSQPGSRIKKDDEISKVDSSLKLPRTPSSGSERKDSRGGSRIEGKDKDDERSTGSTREKKRGDDSDSGSAREKKEKKKSSSSNKKDEGSERSQSEKKAKKEKKEEEEEASHKEKKEKKKEKKKETKKSVDSASVKKEKKR